MFFLQQVNVLCKEKQQEERNGFVLYEKNMDTLKEKNTENDILRNSPPCSFSLYLQNIILRANNCLFVARD